MSQPDAKPRPPGGAGHAELDELTIARAQRGDPRARRALVERYQRPVFAVLSRMLHGRGGHRALVEDLAQETFLRVFRALPGFDRSGPARLSTWILTIATNRAIDELRRRRPQAADAIDVDALAAGRASLDEHAEGQALASALQQAIEGLGPEYRAAFLLRVFHEMSYAEISEALRVDLGTVKSRISRARKALRRALTEVYGGE
ncbi:MAG: sigma-70 family RNA polymerase sigma factor [Myxococcales bacterium]|nr:sigma-70 family RNA polymerase sigma factor [Myxococcales bacterium]